MPLHVYAYIHLIHDIDNKTLSLDLLLATAILAVFISSWLTPSTTTAAAPILQLHASNNDTSSTTTPIKHIVILVQEDISFDHYFGTYPNATNPPGEPKFVASPNTPPVNGLNSTLLYQNPNSANPIRLDRSASVTCAMNHHYTE